ncbi:MAG: hypothetical protein J0H80_01130 [Rhizobiales bacterium]|nr:hypothetical protein [Hyphomicrobiales bacterium]
MAPATTVMTMVSAAAMPVAAVTPVMAVTMPVAMPVTVAMTVTVAVTIAVTAASPTVVRAAAERAGGAGGVGPDEAGGGKCGTGRHDILVPLPHILKRGLVAGGEGRFARRIGACL